MKEVKCAVESLQRKTNHATLPLDCFPQKTMEDVQEFERKAVEKSFQSKVVNFLLSLVL